MLAQREERAPGIARPPILTMRLEGWGRFASGNRQIHRDAIVQCDHRGAATMPFGIGEVPQ